MQEGHNAQQISKAPSVGLRHPFGNILKALAQASNKQNSASLSAKE